MWPARADRRLLLRSCCLALLAALGSAQLGAWVVLKKDVMFNPFGAPTQCPNGFRGLVYDISEGSPRLPYLGGHPRGVIYTCSLNVPPQSYLNPMQDVTERIEWFAIDYRARVWIETPGMYEWALTSDDGSRLYIDERQVIDNDGVHAAQREQNRVELKTGWHDLHVPYYQGPKYEIALQLEVKAPGSRKWRIFDVRDFQRKSELAVAAALAASQKDDEPDEPPPVLRRMKEGILPYEVRALAALDAPTPPKDLAFSAAAPLFRSEPPSAAGSLVFEIPAANLAFARDQMTGGSNVHVSLVALVRDAEKKVVDKASLDFDQSIPDARLAALRASSLTYTYPVHLPPGDYTVAAAVFDHHANRAGTVTLPLTVKTQNGIGLSNVLLVQRVEPLHVPADPSDPFQYDQNRVVPALTSAIPATTQAKVYFVVYPDPNLGREAHVNVEVRRDGQFVGRQFVELPPPDATGAVHMLLAAASQPGHYEMSVTAVQGADFVRRTIQYAIAGP
jgi:hypothetical protein